MADQAWREYRDKMLAEGHDRRQLRKRDFLAGFAAGKAVALPSREQVEMFMRGEGLSDEPWLYDSSIHRWRCEHPDRYGKCDCFEEFLSGLLALIRGDENDD